MVLTLISFYLSILSFIESRISCCNPKLTWNIFQVYEFMLKPAEISLFAGSKTEILLSSYGPRASPSWPNWFRELKIWIDRGLSKNTSSCFSTLKWETCGYSTPEKSKMCVDFCNSWANGQCWAFIRVINGQTQIILMDSPRLQRWGVTTTSNIIDCTTIIPWKKVQRTISKDTRIRCHII